MTTNQTIDGVPRRAVEWAFERLEICQDQAFQSCECEECDQCGKMPDECSGTDCAKTCQCSTCDHCSNALAMTELRALLDAERCTSCDGSGDLIDLTGEWRGYCACPAGVALKNKPAAQPQGEPVAWRSCAAINGKHYITEDSPDQQQERIDKSEPGAYLLASQPLYLGQPEQPAPVANTWPKLSFMAIAAGEHAHADYCQKHAYGSLNEYRNHEALTHAIEVAVAYDKLNPKPAPVAVVMPTQQDFERFIIRRDGSVNVSVLGNSRFYNDATIDSEYFVWLTCLDEVTQLNAKSR